jgi:spermidine synthase
MTPSNLEILAYEDTPLGPLCLRRRELLSSPGTVVTEVTLNHEFLMSSHITVSERALATTALDLCPGQNLSVLVGGLGLGYTAAAALECGRVASVEVVEFLPQVIEWLEDGLFPMAGRLSADERFHLVPGDVYARLLAAPDERFDVILIDVDHAPDDKLTDENASFYVEDGLKRARRHLASEGVLGVWSYAESSPFSEALRSVFDDVSVERVTYFNDVIDDEITDWLFFAR